MKKTIIPFAILFATLTFAQVQTESQYVKVEQSKSKKIILPEGTLVKAALKNEIRGGKMQVGNQIEFTFCCLDSIYCQIAMHENIDNSKALWITLPGR